MLVSELLEQYNDFLTLRVQEAPGSNPGIPTMKRLVLKKIRRFLISYVITFYLSV